MAAEVETLLNFWGRSLDLQHLAQNDSEQLRNRHIIQDMHASFSLVLDAKNIARIADLFTSPKGNALR